MSKTAVTSFVIRFKQEQEKVHSAPLWHGSIRHVQTNQETHFTDIQEALTFMAQFVRIEKRGDTATTEQLDNPEQSMNRHP